MKRCWAGLACLLILAGCAASPVALYTLSGQASQAAATSLGDHPFVIEVARVSIPDDLDTEDIVLQDGSLLHRSSTGRWASRLSLEITALLTHQLAGRTPAALVTDVRQITAPNERLLVSITQLDIAANGMARMNADWQIVPQNADARLLRDRAQFSLSGSVATDHDVVALQTSLIEKLAAAISLPSSP